MWIFPRFFCAILLLLVCCFALLLAWRYKCKHWCSFVAQEYIDFDRSTTLTTDCSNILANSPDDACVRTSAESACCMGQHGTQRARQMLPRTVLYAPLNGCEWLCMAVKGCARRLSECRTIAYTTILELSALRWFSNGNIYMAIAHAPLYA